MLQVTTNEDVMCVGGSVQRSGLKFGMVYSFLVDGMLVDTGPQCIETVLIPFYQNHRFDFVALTHSHEDHSGLAPWIEE